MTRGLTALHQVLRNIHGTGSAFGLPFPPLQGCPLMLDIQALGVSVENQRPKILSGDLRASALPMQLSFQQGHFHLRA
jgi:hypothetical protein